MDPSQFNVDVSEMKKLEKLLSPAESKIIDGNLFKVIIISLLKTFRVFINMWKKMKLLFRNQAIIGKTLFSPRFYNLHKILSIILEVIEQMSWKEQKLSPRTAPGLELLAVIFSGNLKTFWIYSNSVVPDHEQYASGYKIYAKLF